MISGTLMDEIGNVLTSLRENGYYTAIIVFLLFALISALTVMNMLIGILCEVVTAVIEAEKNDAAISLVKDNLLVALKHLDQDGSGEISREEFAEVIRDKAGMDVLQELKVDVPHLMAMQDMLFPDKSQSIPINKVLDLVLTCRGDRPATSQDVIDANQLS